MVDTVGIGTMGRGIQMAALAGSSVWLMDAQAGSAQKAHEALSTQWDRMAATGRIDADIAESYKR